MSSCAQNVTSLVMCSVNFMFSRACGIDIQFLQSCAARSSMCCIPIAFSNFLDVGMPVKCSDVVCLW